MEHLSLSECLYTSHYCEENVWHLCQHSKLTSYKKKVVVISNLQNSWVMWQQRISAQSNQPVLWDYHVILLTYDSRWLVWDMDTRLAFPSPITHYFQKSFNHQFYQQHVAYKPLFRIIDADLYVAQLYSDRSHMRLPDGAWFASPPPWPMITHGNCTLNELIEMGNKKIGECFTYEKMVEYQFECNQV